jgi:hypothetical protein
MILPVFGVNALKYLGFPVMLLKLNCIVELYILISESLLSKL